MTYIHNGHPVTKLYRACSRCGRNAHKVVVRHTDDTFEGFCPSCFSDIGPRLDAKGSVIHLDLRKRVK